MLAWGKQKSALTSRFYLAAMLFAHRLLRTPLRPLRFGSREFASSSFAGVPKSRLSIALRREDKNRWERRVALTPTHVQELIQEHGATIYVQPSNNRVFTDYQYKKVLFCAAALDADDCTRWVPLFKRIYRQQTSLLASRKFLSRK